MIQTTGYMKKFCALSLLLILTSFSFGQETFATKQEAINSLKQLFSKNFIKSAIIVKKDDKEMRCIYDYEITDKYIQIHRKALDEPGEGYQKNDTWTVMPYSEMSTIGSEKEIAGYFKNATGLVIKSGVTSFESGYGISEEQRTGRTMAQSASFPFDITDYLSKTNSITNAIRAINREEKALAETTPQKPSAPSTTDGRKIAYTTLPAYKVFTADSVLVNLPGYIEMNRLYKQKATLLITWSYRWCPPCIRKIDSLLKSGLNLKYNIILVNRDSDMFKDPGSKYASLYISLADLKQRLAERSPNFNKEALVLFDRNDQLADLDDGALPFFLWLDKKLNIVSSYEGFKISVSEISNRLSEIN
jgi:thiol-disulfide isomerase/thioredoxin